MARRNLQHMCLGRTRQKEEFKADIVRAHEGETPVSRAAACTRILNYLPKRVCARIISARRIFSEELSRIPIRGVYRRSNNVRRYSTLKKGESQLLLSRMCMIYNFFRFFPCECGTYIHTFYTEHQTEVLQRHSNRI